MKDRFTQLENLLTELNACVLSRVQDEWELDYQRLLSVLIKARQLQINSLNNEEI